MRRLMMMILAVGVTAAVLVGCGKEGAPVPPVKKATTAAPVTK